MHSSASDPDAQLSSGTEGGERMVKLTDLRRRRAEMSRTAVCGRQGAWNTHERGIISLPLPSACRRHTAILASASRGPVGVPTKLHFLAPIIGAHARNTCRLHENGQELKRKKLAASTSVRTHSRAARHSRCKGCAPHHGGLVLTECGGHLAVEVRSRSRVLGHCKH